jgi:hypothetical protein
MAERREAERVAWEAMTAGAPEQAFGIGLRRRGSGGRCVCEYV